MPVRDLADRAKAYGITGLRRRRQRRARRLRDQQAKPWNSAARAMVPVLIEVKTMRMQGHAQHDPAEYVPKRNVRVLEGARSHRALRKISDREQDLGREGEIRNRRAHRTRTRQKIRNSPRNSPLPPPELAEQGVYCEGCHTIEAEWKRPIEEVTPPKSSVKAEWTVERFRRARPRRSGRDELRQPKAARAATDVNSKWLEAAALPRAGSKPPVKLVAKTAAKNGSKSKPAETHRALEGETIIMAQVTYLEAIRQALFEEMDRDPAVLLMGEDVGVYGGAFQATAGLLERFGWERVVDTPISEAALVGAAAGISYLGLRPVVEMQFMDFVLRLRANRECGGQVALPLGRTCAAGDSRAGRRRCARRSISFRESGNVLRAHAGAAGGVPSDGL